MHHSFQNIIDNYDTPESGLINERLFHHACLGEGSKKVLKLLISTCKTKNCPWKEWLFGQDNIFAHKAMSEKSEFGEFLNKIYEREVKPHEKERLEILRKGKK